MCVCKCELGEGEVLPIERIRDGWSGDQVFV